MKRSGASSLASFPARDYEHLDDPSWFALQFDIFVSDVQPWDLMDSSLPKYEHYMPRH